MTNKEYLGGAYRIDQRINSKIEQAASLRDLATKATATYSDTPASGGGDIQSMEAVIVKIVDLEQEINADIDALVDFKREIIGAIKSLADPECQMLLELRYLCFRLIRIAKTARKPSQITAGAFRLAWILICG